MKTTRLLRLQLITLAAAPGLAAAPALLPAPPKRPAFAFSPEVRTRQQLLLVSLGRAPADLIVRGATVLDVFSLTWMPDQDIVIKGDRIAYVGPVGSWTGQATTIHDATGLWAVPGFGESHKHIESTHLSPEWEAALVVPFGNTWTLEASHEFSNVNGDHNVEFWLEARKHGSPLKIFPSLGSATPPTAYESGGGYYGYREIDQAMKQDPMVAGLDEVMDWPSVWDPTHPGYQRIWENIQATWDNRGVVEGHGAGLTDLPTINAFAAAGLSSDHEIRQPQEAWDKLQRGIFLQLKQDNIARGIRQLVAKEIKDWSNVSLVTDDRDVAHSLELGTTDYAVRAAIQAGAPVEAAYAMVSYYPARHSHLEHLVGSIAPGRYADLVLLTDPATVAIKRVYADGRHASEGRDYLLPVPKIAWPAWATKTMNIGRALVSDDFVIPAPAGRTTVTAAIQRPFYTAPEQDMAELPVLDGVVQRAPERDIIKVATVDRYHGLAALGKMFWTGLGPKTPRSAVACSVSHDLHNIIVVGTGDAAMAAAVNAVAAQDGGWALVRDDAVIATVRYEVGGLMTSRPPAEVAAELEKLYAAADTMEWIGAPGFPRTLVFSLITCSPFTWRLVVPYEGNPDGLVNLVTGEVRPILR